MAHRCVKCDAVFADDAPEVMTGCACGSKVFMYLREGRSTEGKFEFDIAGLLGRKQETGKYDIDIEAAFKKV